MTSDTICGGWDCCYGDREDDQKDEWFGFRAPLWPDLTSGVLSSRSDNWKNKKKKKDCQHQSQGMVLTQGVQEVTLVQNLPRSPKHSPHAF